MADEIARPPLRPVTLVGGPAGGTIVMIGARSTRYHLSGVCRCGLSLCRRWTYHVDHATHTARYWPSDPHSVYCETGMYPPRQAPEA